MSNYITVEDIREDCLDRVPEDHLVLADIAFTDKDIEWAMKACARKFNALKPFSTTVTHDKLPAASMVFFDGCAWALLRRWHRNVAMNDFDFNAAGVSANVQGSLLKNLDALVPKLEQDFVGGATDLKVHINLNAVYGGPLGE